jgi:hypothetical protein
MRQLKATISPGLWWALLDYANLLDCAEKTQEPLAHIVSKALAEYFQGSPNRVPVGRSGNSSVSSCCSVECA